MEKGRVKGFFMERGESGVGVFLPTLLMMARVVVLGGEMLVFEKWRKGKGWF